jgi:tetratricopeptide (TPR) repeat protein
VLCVVAALGACVSMGQQPSSASADALLGKAIAEQQRGDLKSAIADYRRVLALRPEMAEARANLGAALADAGDLDGAIEEDTRALTNAPDKTAVRMNLALAYYKKGDWQNARTAFAAVHTARPDDLNAAMLLGYSEIKLGQPNAAVILLAPLEAGHSSNMDFEYVLAYGLIENGKLDEGLPRMEASARATHSVDAFVIAGSARLHSRQFKEAEADLDEAAKLAPDFPGLQTLLGQAHDALGDTDGARPAFEAALRQDPRDAMANLYLGTMLLKDRDLDRAGPMLELAVQLQPTMPQARLQLARLESMTGKIDQAAATFEDLEKADPNWLDPHIELAALYYKLHKPEDGQRERDIVQQLESKEQKQGPSQR